MQQVQTKSTSKPVESLDALELRVRDKYYKMYRNIAMQIKVADATIKEVGVRPGNIIGQGTAAATVVIRGHKIIDASRAKETADKLLDISNEVKQKSA